MVNHRTEQDPSKRQELRAERQHLEEFLNSEGFKAGQKLDKVKLNETINFILDFEPSDQSYIPKIMQAIGEARAMRDRFQPYQDRFEEIKELLGDPLPEET